MAAEILMADEKRQPSAVSEIPTGGSAFKHLLTLVGPREKAKKLLVQHPENIKMVEQQHRSRFALCVWCQHGFVGRHP